MFFVDMEVSECSGSQMSGCSSPEDEGAGPSWMAACAARQPNGWEEDVRMSELGKQIIHIA